MSDMREIHLALIGGAGDGKTTFLISLFNQMVYNTVKIENHRIGLKAVGLQKGLKQYNNNEEIIDDSAEDLTNQLTELTSVAKPSSNRSSAGVVSSSTDGGTDNMVTNGGDVRDVMSVMDMNNELSRMFSFPASGGVATRATMTTSYIIVTFEVQVDFDTKCKLILTDYAGEVVDARQENMLAALRFSYASQIHDSDGAIILANAVKLNNNLNHDAEAMFKRDNTQVALNVNNIASLIIAAKEESPYSIIIDINQCDTPNLNARITSNNFMNTMDSLQEEIYDTLVSWAKIKGKSIGFLPVYAFGAQALDRYGNLKENCDLHPRGIDKSILFCIYNITLDRHKIISERIKELEKGLFGVLRNRTEINELTAIQSDLADIRAAISSSPNYFDDVYEKEHENGTNGLKDYRFPNEIVAGVAAIN